MDSTPATHSSAPAAEKKRSPLLTPVIWCILVTETGERFAYYGFRAILVLYFTLELQYDENQAIALFAYTTALAYLSPLAGALLSDGDWGRYKTILIFGCIYVLGLFILTIDAFMDWTLTTKRIWNVAGLLLVCLGTGGIKPCVSSFGADQVGAMKNQPALANLEEEETDAFVPIMDQDGMPAKEPAIDPRETSITEASTQEKQVMTFFSYFYFCINVGAVTSIAIIPILRGKFGFGVAFLLPTLFMVTAMGLFVSMRRQYVHHIPGQDGSSLSNTFILCGWLLRRDIWFILPSWIQRYVPCIFPGPMPILKRGSNRLVKPVHDHDSREDMNSTDSNEYNNRLLQEQLEDAAQALHVMPIMAMLPIFWCLYDQQSSVWTLQATRMELNGLQPEQLNVVNPLQILIFVPLFDRCIYPWMHKHQFNIRPLWRMSCGMLLASAAFFISGYVETSLQYRETNNMPPLNVFWQLPQITLLSVAELGVSVTGLEFAYSTSPERLKAFLMALFLLTTAVGDFLSGILYSTIFRGLDRAWIMHLCGIFMMINLIAFVRLSQWWEERDLQRKRSGIDEGVELRSTSRVDWIPAAVEIAQHGMDEMQQGLEEFEQGLERLADGGCHCYEPNNSVLE